MELFGHVRMFTKVFDGGESESVVRIGRGGEVWPVQRSRPRASQFAWILLLGLKSDNCT